MDLVVIFVSILLAAITLVIKTEKTEKIEEPKVLSETLPPEKPLPPPTNNSLGEFRYPNSTTVSVSTDTLKLESADDPDAITDWYKSKIKSANLSTTSFVVTKTNGNVLNKLVGANSQKEIRVEIKKEAGSPSTIIAVSTY